MGETMGNQGQVNAEMWDLDKLGGVDVSQCAAIMDAVYRVLEETGCVVQNEKALKLLADHGCAVEGQSVKIPRAVMEAAIETTPKELTIYDRLGNPAMVLKPGNTYFGPVIGTVFLWDAKSGEKRYGTAADGKRAVLACEALPHIAWASTLASITDRKKEIVDLYEVRTLLENAVKPFWYWALDINHLERQFDMFEAVCGKEALESKPSMIDLVCPMDPLQHTDNGLEQLMYLAKRNAPVVYIPGISFGVTGPVTAAANIVVGVADALVGLLVSQLTNPGAPFIAAKFTDTLNLATMAPSHSRPETNAANYATADVFRYLGIPYCLNNGQTDCGTFDQVAAFDIATQYCIARIAGSEMNFAIGCLESGNSASTALLAYADFVLSYLDHALVSPKVNAETLAVDAIEKIGPGGNFMMEEDTLEHFGDFFVPDVFAPRTYEAFKSAGSRDIAALLDEYIDDITAAGPKHPLDAATLSELDAIIAKAEREIC